MPTLYAFLIAINDYPNPRHALRGCVNDMHAFRNYLQEYSEKGEFTLLIKTLEDKQAKREDIVEGFDFFQAAKDGDTCLFFFAGHGSCWAAPEAFWHLEPDRKNESLVCYDSRTMGGRDLMDKEISYLIWKVTKDKDVHFVAITDCCHSGTVTRLMDDIRTRRAPCVDNIIPAEDYLGFEDYKKSGDNRYSPPRGRHVHLAASQANETAKEVYVKGTPRGIFTYCLLEALIGSHNRISYAELASRVGMRIRNAVPEQSPLLSVTHSGDQNFFFLSGAVEPSPARYVIGFEGEVGWTLDAGALHGITAGDEDSPTIFELIEDATQISIKKVEANRSLVKGMEDYDENRTFVATLVQQAIPRLSLAFAPGSERDGERLLKDYLGPRKPDCFHLIDVPHSARYLIHARSHSYYLTTPYDLRPLFRRVEGYRQESLVDFSGKLEAVARYIQCLELTNPASSIKEHEIQLELYRAAEAGNYDDDTPTQLLDWRSLNEFPYLYQNSTWHDPAFQLKIINKGQRTLWISLLFMDDKFGITNQLLPLQELEPGQEAWAVDIFKGYPYRTIKLMMDDLYGDWGLTTVDNYLKVFICTEPFDTGHFCQKGLELEGLTKVTKEVNSRSQIQERDWATREIPIRIYRPLSKLSIRGPQSIQPIESISIKVPPGLVGQISLNTLDKAIEAFTCPVNFVLEAGEFFQPFELGPEVSRPDLSVLELFDLKGFHKVSPEQPLEVQIEDANKAIEKIQLFSCDPSAGFFSPIDYEIKDKIIYIKRLPKVSPSPLGESAKVFFGLNTGD